MYKHLSREERYQIHSLLKAKQAISQTARLLGRHGSTISRDLNRGHGQRGYRAEQACAKALSSYAVFSTSLSLLASMSVGKR